MWKRGAKIIRKIERYFGGHVRVGPVTWYGFNAMAFAINIETIKWGYICFRPTTYFRSRWWRWYFYLSPDATPHRSTLAIGPGIDESAKASSSIRRYCFGHNFGCGDKVRDWNRNFIDDLEFLRFANYDYQDDQ